MDICREVLRNLPKYLEGRLDPVLAAGVWLHLGRCQSCNLVADSAMRTMVEYFLIDAPPQHVPERVDTASSSPRLAYARRIA